MDARARALAFIALPTARIRRSTSVKPRDATSASAASVATAAPASTARARGASAARNLAHSRNSAWRPHLAVAKTKSSAGPGFRGGDPFAAHATTASRSARDGSASSRRSSASAGMDDEHSATARHTRSKSPRNRRAVAAKAMVVFCAFLASSGLFVDRRPVAVVVTTAPFDGAKMSFNVATSSSSRRSPLSAQTEFSEWSIVSQCRPMVARRLGFRGETGSSSSIFCEILKRRTSASSTPSMTMRAATPSGATPNFRILRYLSPRDDDSEAVRGAAAAAARIVRGRDSAAAPPRNERSAAAPPRDERSAAAPPRNKDSRPGANGASAGSSAETAGAAGRSAGGPPPAEPVRVIVDASRALNDASTGFDGRMSPSLSRSSETF